MCIRDSRWTRHVIKMGQNETLKKALTEQIYGTRRVGRPKLRWEDGVTAVSYTHLDVYKRQVFSQP